MSGSLIAKGIKEPEEFFSKIAEREVICITDNFTRKENLRRIIFASGREDCNVLCDSQGKPLAVRMQHKNRSRWLVQHSSWFDKNGPQDIDALKAIDALYNHLGVGSAPTPSSLGRKTMRYVFTELELLRHTGIPLACERFIHEHGFGGITITKENAIGKVFSKTSEIDSSSNYLGTLTRYGSPDGTPEHFISLDTLSAYKTWFAEVRVTIHRDLPLGIFPIRLDDRSVIYPTRKGVYYTNLWRETAEIAAENGCMVEIYQGWGWKSINFDNALWSEWIYGKRLSAPTKLIEKGVKHVAVAAIGSLGRSRSVYSLSQNDLEHTGIPVLLGNVPVELYAIPSVDYSSPLMDHWHKYCVSRSNDMVRSFALPFAEEEKLLLIDTDAVFVRGEEGGDRFIHRYDLESMHAPAGTWLWKLHTDFRILRNRMWISQEEPSRYGSLLERLGIH